MNGTDTFLTWFDRQPEEVRTEIAFYCMCAVPDAVTREQQARCDLEPEIEFRRWLTSDTRRRFLAPIGRVLFVRAACSLLVFRNHGRRDDWEEKAELNQEMLQALESEHGKTDMSERLRANLGDFPRRTELWVETAESWKKLCASSLSDEVLEAWLEDVIRP